MHHKDQLYPFWLFLRQTLLDSVPEVLHHYMAITCGQVASQVTEEARTKLKFGDTAAQAAKILELQEALAGRING